MIPLQFIIVLILLSINQSIAQIGTIRPGDYGTFESPSNAQYVYNPALTVLNPWTWTNARGGIAQSGSPFQPGAPADPPSPNQFAFLQITNNLDANMTTTLTNLTIGATYTLEFYYSARFDVGRQTSTFSRLAVFLGDSQLFVSAQNITVTGGWVPVRVNFVAAVISGPLVFNNRALLGDDRSILIDSVSVQSINFTPAQYSIPLGSLHSFESPSLNASTYGTGLTMQIYNYNPGTTPSQPFIWSSGLGGLALVGAPFDAPAPNTPPDGRQYAFVQTSPNGQLNKRSSFLNSSYSGLTVGTAYVLSFYWSIRADGGVHNRGLLTESQVTVRMGTTVIFVSNQNLTATAGWYQNTTAPFIATATTLPISFNINSLTDHDHTVLFDAIMLDVATSSSSSGAVAVSSSSTGAAGPSSSSPTATSPSSSTSVARSSSSSVVSSSSTAAAGASSSSTAIGTTSSPTVVPTAVTSSARSSSSAVNVVSSSSTATNAISSSSSPSTARSSSSSSSPVIAASSSATSSPGDLGQLSSSTAGFDTSSFEFTSTSSSDATNPPDDGSLNGAPSIKATGSVMIAFIVAVVIML